MICWPLSISHASLLCQDRPMTVQLQNELERILELTISRDASDVMRELWGLCSTVDVEGAELLLATQPKLLDHRPVITRAFNEMVVAQEISQARQLLQRKLKGSESFAEIATAISLYSYERSADMFDYLDFRECRQLVLVGCGWVPATLFYVHDKTNISELVGLDVVPHAVETANELAQRLGYTRVRAEPQNGSTYDYGQAQIVYVVGMVGETKSAVLARIADTAPGNVQVMLNEPYSLGRIWSSAVEPSLDGRFYVAKRGQGRATRRNLLLKLR
jgi:hypothetical protein